MKRSLRRALWATGAVVALAVAAVPMATASAAGSVTATFTKVQDWGTGHEARVTVTNGTSASVATWRVEFDLPAGTTISSSWDADVTSSGNHYVAVKKSWAGPLAPGASFSWGYNGVGAYKAPLTCTVNGASCSGGGTPPTTTPPTTTPP
ncbi:cellulose binding domain-containing protein, partial [Micromonospora sp. AMSO31t]|uniref:cellulose binding domain-containing protein n=2 Tax=unclassified Micromonospora TaxID=2617518 RepID=UPI001324ABE3